MLTNKSEHRIKNIDTVGRKKKCKDYLEDYSLYSIRFGVYIKNSTKFVNNFAIMNSFVVVFILILVLTIYLSQINSVEFCCNVIQEKPDDKFNTTYNFQVPDGAESWLFDLDFTENITLLFPLEIFYTNLTCDDLKISLIAQKR